MMQKTTAEHGTIATEEKQTLLSKQKKILNLNQTQQDFIKNSV